MADQLSSDLASLRISRDQTPPSSPWIRRLLIAAVLIAAVWVAWYFAKPILEARVFKTEVELTQIVLVSPSQSQAKLTSTGYVVPQRVSHVGAKTPGRIKTMLVREGDTVIAGAVLARLEDSELRAQLQAAQARVLAAKAEVQTAKAELADRQQQAQRERKLVSQGVGAAATAEDLEAAANAARMRVAAAQANVRAASAEVDRLQVAIDDAIITAPMDGTVVAKPAQAGELVGIQASALVELADFSSLMVETDVPEGRLHLIEIDGPAEIVLDAFPKERYAGRVRGVSPRVNRAKATVTVKVAFERPTEHVLPDMAARVSFLEQPLDPEQLKEAPKLIVPAAAIAERDGAKVVFVVQDGIAHMHGVTLGPAYGSGFELLNGPPAGSNVIREPAATIFDGHAVKQKGEST